MNKETFKWNDWAWFENSFVQIEPIWLSYTSEYIFLAFIFDWVHVARNHGLRSVTSFCSFKKAFSRIQTKHTNNKFRVIKCVVIPHVTSCGGYDVFYKSDSQSVSHSVSPVFLVSATPLKPFNRISLSFILVKDPLCVSFITNIKLWFTTWLTNTTFHNGGMHNVQDSQAMLERGVCELARFFFHCK